MWLSPETKTCHICQGKEHLAANCPRIQEKGRNEKRILKLSELYKKKHVNADNVGTIHKKAEAINSRKKSYLDAAKGPSPRTANTSPDNIETKLYHLEKVIGTIQVILEKLIEKNVQAKTGTKPDPAPHYSQKTLPRTVKQTT